MRCTVIECVNALTHARFFAIHSDPFVLCPFSPTPLSASVSACLPIGLQRRSAELIIPQMAAACRHASAHTRGTMVAALKFAIARHSNSDACRAAIGEFTALLADADIGVRRQAFLTLNAVLHAAFDLVADRLGAVLPMVFAETVVHPELIREVDLGPFKRRIDDGFPLRKAAFQVIVVG